MEKVSGVFSCAKGKKTGPEKFSGPEGAVSQDLAASYTRPWYMIPAVSKSAPLRMIAAAVMESERINRPMRVW